MYGEDKLVGMGSLINLFFFFFSFKQTDYDTCIAKID